MRKPKNGEDCAGKTRPLDEGHGVAKKKKRGRTGGKVPIRMMVRGEGKGGLRDGLEKGGKKKKKREITESLEESSEGTRGVDQS